MMKIKRIGYAFLLLLIFAGMMNSCVKDDDYSTPDININPPEIDGTIIDISTVKTIFMQEAGANNINSFNGTEQYTFQGTKYYMEGYVNTSDESGNFYQEISFQDKAENPTSGIKMMILANPMYTRFEIGRKVYVELDGFTIGFSNGVLALGVPQAGSNFIAKAPQTFQSKILRDPEIAELVPREMTVSDFKRENDHILIRLNNVEFPANIALGDNAKTFAAEPGEQFDAERLLEICGSSSTTMLITSTFADFKALKLPTKSGHIDALLTKTFNGSAYRLKINSPEDLNFEDARCDGTDPEDPEEPVDPSDAVDLPFLETFEGLSDYDVIDQAHNGWMNIDVSGSSRKWEARSFGGNTYAQLTAFNANAAVETWLITPGLNLTTVDDAQLTFDTKDGYYTGAALSVYISTNFTGNPNNADWTELSVNLSQGNSNGYADNFTSSGVVDLSSYAGNVIHVAFKYAGDPNGATTTYQVDNVSVKSADGEEPGEPEEPEEPEEPSEDAVLAFAGADFEDWNTFLGGINNFGIKDYATHSEGTGIDGSGSLHIFTDPMTTNGNDYVFTSVATSNLPSTYSKITFKMRGASNKSVSINVYKDGDYYKFNLDGVTGSKTVQASETNQYTGGTINTGGQWVTITLDLSNINDLNTSNTAGDFFALKIGKNADYDLHFDDFYIE